MSAQRILPTTMVGSYPRPLWFTQQLAGRDVLEAFKVASHAEAFHDATRTVIKDQEDAGLDVLTDGQMWFDDYHMGIGSFLWYWLERTKGFSPEKLPHPARDSSYRFFTGPPRKCASVESCTGPAPMHALIGRGVCACAQR